jgi:lysophospholipase L1-like esterase
LIVWFGANDAVLSDQIQHVPLATYKQNLKTILNLVRDPASPYHSPTTELILITPPPIDPPAWAAEVARKTGGQQVGVDRTTDNTRRYAEACREVAQEEGVPCVDAWSAINDQAQRIGGSLEPFMYDGLHLNSDGYRIVSKGGEAQVKLTRPESDSG